jgi:L-lactate dehydrogenase
MVELGEKGGEKMSKRVVIIGTGAVGMSFAYAMLNRRTVVDELYLVDLDKQKTEGEAIDLRDGLGFAPGNMRIRAGGYEDCQTADIVVITAGARQAEGETRMDLIRKNAGIFKGIVEEVMKSGFDGIFLVVSNPMDVMTHLTWKYSGLPHARVIGSGTVLDSSRLMYKVGHKLKVDPRSVHAYMLGEHGDSEFAAWKEADVGLERLGLSEEEMMRLEDEVRNEAYEIIKRKGATYYGIGVCLTHIVESILTNSGAVLPVSNWDPFAKTYFGWPAVVGREGIRRRIGLELTAPEQRKLEKSIGVIKEAVNGLG